METEESNTKAAASWYLLQKDRLLAHGNNSDISGKKRKQESTVGHEPVTCILEDKVEQDTTITRINQDEEEPSNKKVKPFSKGTGLASLMGPVKSTSLKRIGQSIQRSISFKTEARPFPAPPLRQRPKNSTTVKRRNSLLWSDTVEITEELSMKEIKRQEVIFELTQGEQQLIDDLSLVKKAYYEPMLKLDIMAENELTQIFGTLDSLIPLHEDLVNRLHNLRGTEGAVDEVGPTLMEWFPCLDAYITYCCNQVTAKALLDIKKQDPRVEHFLRLCQESSFSRKLDLWNFLDLPRSRLVKYPLLLKEIVRHTNSEHPDKPHLEEAMELIQRIVADVNRKTGEAECHYYRSQLHFVDEIQRIPEILRSQLLLCHGDLKNNKGQKLHVFLFELVLVLSRPFTQNDKLQFQVFRQPIPIGDLLMEDLPDGDTGLAGSFRGAFTSANDKIKNCFRVSSKGRLKGHAYSLQANDSFNKQQWISCIRQAIVSYKDHINILHLSPEINSGNSSLDDIADLSIECDEKECEDVEMNDQYVNNKGVNFLDPKY